MPVAPTFPGVYIEEIPSGVRTIVGVATSIAAFVDNFRRGPLGEAVQIFSFADFEREFGGLDDKSEASYAIQQFFLNGGTEAFVVRVGTAGLAPLTLTPAAAILTAPVPAPNQVVRATAGHRIRGASVRNPGVWGNFLRIEVDYDTVKLPNASLDPAGILLQNELFNLTVAEVELRDGRTFVLRTETFRNLTMRPGIRNNAIEVVNEGSKLVQLNRVSLTPPDPLTVPAPPASIFRPTATGTLGNSIATIPALGGPPLNLTVTIAATAKIATLDFGTATLPTDLATWRAFVRPYLEAAIRAATPADNNPLFTGATVQLMGDRFRVLAGRTGKSFDPDATVTFTGGPADALQLSVAQGATVGPQQIRLTGGGDSDALTEAALRGNRALKIGLFALEDVDLFNILCLPAAASLGAVDMRAVYTTAEAYCEERRAFLIVDIPPDTDSLTDMQDWLTQNGTLRHRNAAVYFPRVLIADALAQNRLRNVGASGTLAGLYALTDAARGVWKAPAGTEARLRGVQELAYVLTDRENGALNPLGVNALRNFPVFSNISWGARTLDGADQLASDWKYIPVRRLALFLEESLFRGTQWVVFEPNDEPLWAQIRLNLGAFMQDLFRKGAFQGQTPREAYFVKCDKETTTQTDINLGIVNVVVGFAPLKPAEFVIIKIQQIAGQIPT
jgi:uncharacterized protein